MASLAVAESDTTFLVAGNWGEDGRPSGEMPGEAGVMRWTRSSWELWLPASELVAAARHLDLPSEPYLIPRAIGRTGDGSGYWVLAAVRKVSDREMREREERLGGGSWQGQPLFKEVVYRGAIWQVSRDGSVLGASAFDAYPDGLAGPDHFFSVTEHPTIGFRGVRVYRLRTCEPLDRGI